MRTLSAALLAAAMTVSVCATAVAAERDLVVKKTSGCGCCKAWIDHMTAAGYAVTAADMAMGALTRFKLEHGITAKLASCHTGRIGGYTIEGHVPAREVTRLLQERPDAIGLSVPEMPIGSPGMEVGDTREAYDVLLIRRDGSTDVYASYPGSGARR